jgi:peptide/nickel transport system permease protein
MGSRTRRSGHRTRYLGLIIGGATLLLLACSALFAGVLAPHSPNVIVAAPLLPPSRAFPLGTDEIGRDILSRVLYGGRVELFVSLTASLLAGAIGVTIGLLVGLRGGLADSAAMRGVEIVYSFPGLILSMYLITVLGRGVWVQIIAIAIVLVPYITRLCRGLALQLRVRSYVEASRLAGGNGWHVFRRHLLPNAMSTILVTMSMQAAAAITIAAGLSYLGVGVRAPTPSWGTLMSSSFNVVYQAPLYGLVPGALIVITALSYMSVANGLRVRLAVGEGPSAEAARAAA